MTSMTKCHEEEKSANTETSEDIQMLINGFQEITYQAQEMAYDMFDIKTRRASESFYTNAETLHGFAKRLNKIKKYSIPVRVHFISTLERSLGQIRDDYNTLKKISERRDKFVKKSYFNPEFEKIINKLELSLKDLTPSYILEETK